MKKGPLDMNGPVLKSSRQKLNDFKIYPFIGHSQRKSLDLAFV